MDSLSPSGSETWPLAGGGDAMAAEGADPPGLTPGLLFDLPQLYGAAPDVGAGPRSCIEIIVELNPALPGRASWPRAAGADRTLRRRHVQGGA
jgi:hypothetical protein